MHFYSFVEKSQEQPEEYFPWFVQFMMRKIKKCEEKLFKWASLWFLHAPDDLYLCTYSIIQLNSDNFPSN